MPDSWKRRRMGSSGDASSAGDAPPRSVAELQTQLQLAISNNDAKALAEHIMFLCGMDRVENSPSKTFSDLFCKASHEVTEAVTNGIISHIEEVDKNCKGRSAYFAAANVPVDCIAEIANYLAVDEKVQLATLNRSWKQLSMSHYFWHVLDPFPVSQFSNYKALKIYLNQNKQKFVACRQLQLPRIPASLKLFVDIFKAMPRLNSISLFNVTGAHLLNHCISRMPNPANLTQLSIGLSSRISPMEVADALKYVGKY
jgi:hypothetical protein